MWRSAPTTITSATPKASSTNATDGPRRSASPGRITAGAEADRIWNGADDDGSGTVTLLAMARAFALGPRPKRSVLFVWHAGEERGRWGSLYFADHADRRPRSHRRAAEHRHGGPQPRQQGERIEHAVSGRVRPHQHRARPDRAGGQPDARRSRSGSITSSTIPPIPSSSTRAAITTATRRAGIPVIFFTTGLHPDYHANTDEVSKIEFDKMSRVGEFIYETGLRLANLDHAPAGTGREHDWAP